MMIDWMEKARRRLRIEAMIGGSMPKNAFDQFLADTREELASTCLGQPLITSRTPWSPAKNGLRATTSHSLFRPSGHGAARLRT